MTEITFDNGVFTAKGHANYAEHGKDIVCASISMMAYTMAASLDGNSARLLPGDTEITYRDTPDNRAIIGAMQKGFMLLADSYPDHVKVRVNKNAL